MSRIIIAALAAAVLAGAGSGVAEAATAHNSQAGSWGRTTHDCLPTPYFRDGGCSPAAFDDRQIPLFPPADRERDTMPPPPDLTGN